MNTGGDDLEDDFVIDDLVALSGDELEADDKEQSPNPVLSDVDDNAPEQKPDAQDAKQSKKRKLKEKQKQRKKLKLAASVDTDANEGPSLASQPPQALVEYLASMQAKTKTCSNLSALELEDMRIPESSIADTSMWDGSRTLDQLVKFITETLPSLRTRLGQKSKSNGSPTLLFIAGAALRVADVTRVLKDKSLRGEKGGEVAKLFAKHFKVAEHVSYLKRTKVGAAVGTPGRIGKLLSEEDALSVSALSHIILDTTYRDSKNRSLLDIPETREEVFQTVLCAPKVLEGLKQGKIQLVLF
ncbi:hypothetical protein HGRIS_013273 [Hohenbuehelia grisea]|uniref:Protein CMS1 n=1 Tax=Hohenbuehelia grisea TaxID=104357 RepID=A0ABR3IV78_9AGAR